MNFVALDFETANFKRESVCSIGLAIVEDFQVVKTIYKLIRPTPNYYENINMSIHGITPAMTETENTFAELWSELNPYFENQQIVAHNASFDFSALRYVLDNYQITYPNLDYFCSMLISKKLYPGLFNYQLPTIVKHLGIKDLSHHNALSDAVACAMIMIQICKDSHVESLGELEESISFSKGQIYPNSYNPFRCCISRESFDKQLFEIVPESTDFDTENPFYEKRIVFTGDLTKLSRNDAKQAACNIGGIIKPDSLCNKTNYLVVGTYDFNQYGEGYKSNKMKKAEILIEKGYDLEIISEVDFFKMVHSQSNSFEITINQIETDSNELLRRNKYNDFAGKTVYFSSDLSIERTIAFQHVGNCSGFGHDYDLDSISNTDYFVISEILIADLNNGIKNKSILDFEQRRNKADDSENAGSVKLIRESTYLEYINRRILFQKNEIEMHMYEWEIK